VDPVTEEVTITLVQVQLRKMVRIQRADSHQHES